MRRQLVQTSGADDVMQRRTVNIGHGEVLDRSFGPGRMDRHDVGVVEMRQHLLLGCSRAHAIDYAVFLGFFS